MVVPSKIRIYAEEGQTMESFIRTMVPKLDSLTTEMKSRIDAIPHNYLEENVYVTDHLLSLQSSLDWKNGRITSIMVWL